MLRRLKRDVAPELPPRTDAVLHVELDDGERAVYDAVRAATQKDVRRAARTAAARACIAKALEALLRLRQAACHPALVPGPDRADTSSKIEALLEALETAVADGHKALVFSQWTSLLDLIEPALARAELSFARLDGTTRDRGDVVARFQADDGPPVMLVSLKAGGIGPEPDRRRPRLPARSVVEPRRRGAGGRPRAPHRPGRARCSSTAWSPHDTVEERILALQEQKRALVDAALGDADRAAGLTREDLLALLS